LHDLLHHVLLARIRDERAGEHLVEHHPVLLVERLVELPVLPDVDDVLRRRVLARDALRGIAARHDDENDEHDERDRRHHEDGADDAPHEERQH
jgi:hypothetical protein